MTIVMRRPLYDEHEALYGSLKSCSLLRELNLRHGELVLATEMRNCDCVHAVQNTPVRTRMIDDDETLVCLRSAAHRLAKCWLGVILLRLRRSKIFVL